MTISELRLALDLKFDNKAKVLKRHAKQLDGGYLFVDSSNGEFYLFDEDGNEDDIAKLDCIEDKLFFDDESLKIVRIPDNAASIGDTAFTGCTNLTSVTIPNSVTSIGNFAFYKCSRLTSVTIPANVTNIGSYAFRSCTGLTSVTIPESVTSIGNWVFSKCTNLKELIFKGKTLDEVKSIDNYPWGIKDESVIKCES